MNRPKLRVHTGCERCKKRKKKCDEARPQCSYCHKWNFLCHYTLSPASLPPRSHNDLPLLPLSATGASFHSPVALSAGHIDPFHRFPVASIDGKLWKLFTHMVTASLPFDFKPIHESLARGWLEAAYGDASVCTAFVAYIAGLDGKQTRQEASNRTALEAERRLLQLLQHKIDCGKTNEASLSLASSIHLSATTMTDFSIAKLESLGRGLRVLLRLYGENQVPASAAVSGESELTASRIMGISISDHLVSFLTRLEPLVCDDGSPDIPASLLEHNAQIRQGRLPMPTAALERVMREMQMALSFRKPSQFTRRLTREEASFLFTTLHALDVQLRWLNYNNQGQGTYVEFITLILMMLKEAVFRDSRQHEVVLVLLNHRLRAILAATLSFADGITEDIFAKVVVWACLVGVYQHHVPENEAFFYEAARQHLEQMADRQAQGAGSALGNAARGICRQLLWHELMDPAIDSLVLYCEGGPG